MRPLAQRHAGSSAGELGLNPCYQGPLKAPCKLAPVCSSPTVQVCELCKGATPSDSPVVYADRAGYSKQWHPACFVCVRCSEPLVDLIYFWKDGAPWCGRHYCESLRPRCSGCDEVGRSEGKAGE